MSNLWELEARVSSLSACAEGWLQTAGTCTKIADELANLSEKVLAEWDGPSADAFSSKRSSLVADLDAAATIAFSCSSAATDAANAVVRTQVDLDTSWARVSEVPHLKMFQTLTFFPQTSGHHTLIEAEEAAARAIRAALDSALQAICSELATLTASWASLTDSWQSVASGNDFIPLPDEQDKVGIIINGDQAILSAGSGDNHVTVAIDSATGDQLVSVDGVTYRIPADKHLTIRGGAGEDTIELPAGTKVGFRVAGGKELDRITGGGGDDRILGNAGDDIIEAGRGADYVSGGAGADYLDAQDGNDRVFGGTGRDTLYGLNGADKLSGGADVDYLEGGAGSDVLFGGDGSDILSGGRGSDQLAGGSGSDVNYGGLGSDITVGGLGHDTLYDDKDRTSTDSVETSVSIEIEDHTSFIMIEGSADFVTRVQADLDLLCASPSGTALVSSLHQQHEDSAFWPWDEKNTLTIKEWVPPSPGTENSLAKSDGKGHMTVEYLPSIDDFHQAPPVVVLQHELAHIDGYMSGNHDSDPYQGDDPIDQGIEIGERQAVGLPIDHDHDPSTPERIDPNQPLEKTENGLREEMGLPPRAHYK